MNEKKMIFIQYNPDDMLNGCRLASGPAELVYRRLCDLIYITDNKLFDDDDTWNVLLEKFDWNKDTIKEELIKKNKIYLENGYLKNKGCDKAIEKAKLNHESASIRGKKGADSRWNDPANGTANGTAIANHKPQTTNHKPLNYKTIMEVWNRIVPTSHIQQMNDTRKNLFRSRFKSYFKESYEEWENFLSRISKISFLWGSNDRDWKADFNWVLNENNLLKILEGKYETDNKGFIPSSDSSYQSRLRIFKGDKITPFLLGFAQRNEADVREAVLKKDITKERAEELGIKID